MYSLVELISYIVVCGADFSVNIKLFLLKIIFESQIF